MTPRFMFFFLQPNEVCVARGDDVQHQEAFRYVHAENRCDHAT